MKLKVDENLPIEVAEALQHAGHDAVTVHDQRLTGRPDLSWRMCAVRKVACS